MVTFYLKEPKTPEGEKPTPTLIYLTFYFQGRRFKHSTGQHVTPPEWNKAKRRVRKEAKGSASINAYLDRLEAKVKEIYLRMLSDFYRITPDSIRRELVKETNTGGTRETFLEFIDRLIRETKAKPGTIKIFKSVLSLLKGYRGQKDFNDIDPDWFHKYQTYLENRVNERTPGGCSANYIAKNIVYIRELLGEALRQGLTRSEAWRSKGYEKPSEEAETIYLSENELLYIYGIELPDNLDRIRDRFLIGAYTGLRFSDFSKLDQTSILSGMIQNVNTKTGETVVIPIHWVVRQIFDKYQGDLPPSISNQKMNKYLKLIGSRAGIKQKIVKNRTNGGVRTGQTFEKWELITTHTARRSAATNMYIAGIPSISIMKITGHRTEKSFMRYIRISQQENAELIASHPYYQSPGSVDKK